MIGKYWVFIFVLFSLQDGLLQDWQDSISRLERDTTKLHYLKEKIVQLVYSSPQDAYELSIMYDSIATIVGVEVYKAHGSNLKGISYYAIGKYDEAMPYFIEALDYFEESKDSLTLALVYNNLATCYQVRNENGSSIDLYKKALLLYESLHDSLGIANVNSNLGLQYLNDANYDAAGPHLEEAVKIYDMLGQEVYKGIALLSRGNLHVNQGDYKKAIVDYNQVAKLVPYSVSPLVHAAAQGGTGTAYNKLGDHDKALPLLLSSLKIAKEINHFEQQREVLTELADLYSKKRDFEAAYNTHKLYVAAKDSVFTKEQDANLVEAMTKYETVKKEKEISELNALNQLRMTQLNARKRQLLLVSIGLVLLLSFFAGIYSLYGRLKEQKKIVEVALSERNTLLKEIHHRVKNNLQVISSLLALQSKYIKDDDALDALKEGQHRVQSMALIHQDLYQHDNLKGVDTNMYLEELIESLLESYKVSEEDVVVETDIDSILLDVDTMIPLGLIINELVSNAFKHAFKDGKAGFLSLRLKDFGDYLLLQVADNGVGVKDFDGFKDASFGYSLIKSFAHKLDAQVSVDGSAGFFVKMTIKNFKRA